MIISFRPTGWADYLYWQADRKVLARVNFMLKEIARDPPFAGWVNPSP